MRAVAKSYVRGRDWMDHTHRVSLVAYQDEGVM